MTHSERENETGTVHPRVHASDLKLAINAAFVDNAHEESRLIGVTTDALGGVTLRGTVATWAQSRQAERACWAADGITAVDNQLHVSH